MKTKNTIWLLLAGVMITTPVWADESQPLSQKTTSPDAKASADVYQEPAESYNNNGDTMESSPESTSVVETAPAEKSKESREGSDGYFTNAE